MGRYDSSKYRVTPLMDLIRSDPSYFDIFTTVLDIGKLSTPYLFCYGENEIQLKPSKAHLSKLIDYMAEKDFTDVNISNLHRHRLCHGSPDERLIARLTAQKLLNEQYDSLSPAVRSWFIFEGHTNPDIYIEGDDYILLGEGKWTEGHITTETVHLSSRNGEYRNQMVRHIQGAINHTDKAIHAFYIVDEFCGYTEDLTKAAFTKQLEYETIPLSETEKQQIASCYHGYVTWQSIHKALPTVKFLTQAEIDSIT